MSKPYSGIPINETHTWTPPRWLKELFVAFAVVAIAIVGVSKAVQHLGGRFERAKAAVEADDLSGPAPALSLPQRKRGTVDLSQKRGKLVLVNFWATWCEPCRVEMPSLEKLAGSLDPSSFEVVAVSVDDGWEPVERFLRPNTPLTVALDKGGLVSQRYGTSKFPESYLVDSQGNVRLKFIGPRDWMDKNMLTLLEELGARRRL